MQFSLAYLMRSLVRLLDKGCDARSQLLHPDLLNLIRPTMLQLIALRNRFRSSSAAHCLIRHRWLCL